MTNKRKLRKLFILFVIIFITAVVLVFETYAWFVGITTVNVDEFQVTVTGAQGLELSLNGQHWTNMAGGSSTNKLTLSSDNILSTAAGNANQGYSGSGNVWPTNGLKPLSSAGVLSSNGRLEIFDKSSLSATAGGYKLVSNKVNNTTTEADGYIAFDLFIRNGTDSDNVSMFPSTLGWENIYLTKDSTASNATGTNHGVANSVRVGFFEIATMKTTTATDSTTLAAIRGLSCSTSTNSNTIKICQQDGQGRTNSWNIWEPNYNVHVTNTRTYFNHICKQRDSSGGYLQTTACSGFTSDSSELKTYAIYNQFNSNTNVDIYDGLNGYTANTTTTYSSTSTSPLMEMATYQVNGSTTYTADNQIFKLNGNSITKIRVYIWLEGQDVDNYDVIASDTINIKFGFTKDRFGIENT